MNILHVNNLDLRGRRFNGYDMCISAQELGHCANQFVICKESKSPFVFSMDCFLDLHGNLVNIQKKFSLHNMLIPHAKVLVNLPFFLNADIVHYHLVHNNIFAIQDFPMLTNKKPAVWTWHDPWALTGHCIHPLDCDGWKSACASCPHLDWEFPLNEDTAGINWKIKNRCYANLDVDIVVSSDFMMDIAKRSPLGQLFPRIHKIPFGINLNDFSKSSYESARARFKIPKDNFVVAFRNEENPYKGVKYIIEALNSIEKKDGVSVLTIGSANLPCNIKMAFHSIELGWQNNQDLLSDFYSACDVFLMPSVAESFGMMAVEAMASSRPVVCFEGTALPSVTFAPYCGVAVPQGGSDMLRITIERLRHNPKERRTRGELGHKIACEHYSFKDYVRSHLELYEEVISRRKTLHK